MTRIDIGHMIYPVSGVIVTARLSCTIIYTTTFTVYVTTYRVELTLKSLSFSENSCDYRPQILSHSCIHTV